MPNIFSLKDIAAVGGSSLGLNIAMSALIVPLRLGLAIKTAKWVDENIIQRFKGNTPK